MNVCFPVFTVLANSHSVGPLRALSWHSTGGVKGRRRATPWLAAAAGNYVCTMAAVDRKNAPGLDFDGANIVSGFFTKHHVAANMTRIEMLAPETALGGPFSCDFSVRPASGPFY